MINSSIKNSIKDNLHQKYRKLVLNFEEVENEVLDSPKLVPSNSVVPNTWLIDDVVNYVCRLVDPLSHLPRREAKLQAIEVVNRELQKYWVKQGYL
ncbi:MAG: hypothetical protein RL154_489 [Pseudomonadota bacterium]|jgi:hypothetical protein